MTIRSVLSALLTTLCIGTGTFAAEPQSLFNGKDLTGWDADPRHWSVEEGAIVGRTTAENPLKHNEFLIWKAGKLKDFKLTLDYRIEGGNSGVQYRSKVLDAKEWIVAGYQADIDSGPTYTGILYEERLGGILAKRGEKLTIDSAGKRTIETFADPTELQKHVKQNDWNHYEIEAIGPALRHTINGKLMSETIDNDPKRHALSGVLALQIHTGEPMTVRFRNILLKEIKDTREAR